MFHRLVYHLEINHADLIAKNHLVVLYPTPTAVARDQSLTEVFKDIRSHE